MIRPHGSKDFDRVLLYSADSIEHSEDVKLTRGGLILFALLTGGDYDQGIHGCGKSTARALAQCGFGDTLLDAVTSISGVALQNLLYDWRQDLREELMSNSHGYLENKNPALAKKITSNFPNHAIMELYLRPLTSWSLQSGAHIPNSAVWRSREPIIPLITEFCLRHFGWGRNFAIVKRFRAALWEGVIFRMVCSVRFLTFLYPYYIIN